MYIWSIWNTVALLHRTFWYSPARMQFFGNCAKGWMHDFLISRISKFNGHIDQILAKHHCSFKLNSNVTSGFTIPVNQSKTFSNEIYYKLMTASCICLIYFFWYQKDIRRPIWGLMLCIMWWSDWTLWLRNLARSLARHYT